MRRPPTSTSRASGSSPRSTRWASASQAGTIRGAPPDGAHSTSREDGPWRGSKKHGGVRSGGSRPASRSLAEVIAKRPSSSAAPTGSKSSGARARSTSVVRAVVGATARS